MFEKSALLVVSALGLLLVMGCSSYVKRGEALYADGRYIEAAEVFERTEGRIGEASVRQRAEYGMYRALTLLVLGDLSNAERWFNYAYEVERAAPGSLSTDRRDPASSTPRTRSGQQSYSTPWHRHGPLEPAGTVRPSSSTMISTSRRS